MRLRILARVELIVKARDLSVAPPSGYTALKRGEAWDRLGRVLAKRSAGCVLRRGSVLGAAE